MARKKVSLEIFGYIDDSWKFNPLHVLGQSLALAQAHWKTLAWWGLAPFVLQLGCTMVMPASATEEGQGYYLLGSLLLIVLMGVTSMLFSIRMYRLVLCADTQPAPYWRQLFQRRTWTYIKGMFKIFLAVLVFSPVFGLAGYLTFGYLGGLKGTVADSIPAALRYPVFMLLASVLFWMYAGPMLMLLFPDAAADGKGSYSDMDDLGSPARWRILVILCLTWSLSYLVTIGQLALGTQLAAMPVWASVAGGVVAQAIPFVGAVIGSIAGALVYRHLKAGWQVVKTVASEVSDSKL